MNSGEGEITVIGLGRSGIAATRLLRRAGAPVYASDAGRSPVLEGIAAGLRALGATVELGGHDLERIARAAGCVVSPGVPPDAPPVAAARQAGVPIRAEAELGLEALSGVNYIAVTGTNGKSTTTALIGHLLGRAGRRALAVGNLGTPLSDIALEPVKPEWLAVELSSFQLHDMQGVRPAVGVLTNLAPDHLDRYASLADYYADKRRFFRNATAESLWVSNADDPASRAMLSGVAGRQLQFSVHTRADGWYDREADLLRLGEEPLLPRARLALLGDHNVANALAAALAVRATGVELTELAAGLGSFAALPHRMEPVGEVNGVLWINDSKATNLASTEVALAALSRPFVLLLGGRHKGEPYTRLAPLLRTRCRAVIAYGEAGPIVQRDLVDAGVPLVPAGSFEDVMARARELAREGDAVLLSPACSSYDMFNNYEERGKRFREIVQTW
ncbi:MAG TPA: UDP-N-acetylmuramoyl-L-alanine--D-glutamate ligase [Gemmatimonadales bacterium]|nr:UDP-N-acetylmuramoyl-L-alanine--D-glutamate ligase [Gemmatimonadales bacterium]